LRVPEELRTFLLKEKAFFIATHVNPEGDALGSSIALAMALESIGKEVLLYDRDPVPHSYRFLPGHEKFKNYYSPSLVSRIPLILLDCNEIERAGLADLKIPCSAVIDHHETLRAFGDIKWIMPHAAATGMMVYWLIKEIEVPLTRDMAINIYTAIANDTGTFRYSNTSSEVLRICAELIDSGVPPGMVSECLYETWSAGRFKLMTDVFQTLDVRGDVAMIHATEEMFRRTGTSASDTENFSNFPRMINEIRISVFFRKIKDGWKISLRSKGDANVAEIAALFNGGGHRNAAGYKITADDINSAKDELIKALTEKGLLHSRQ
jgi:bifunctional oligoribonuclease and PAP phosphatase NrnA